nr:helix-turn-helix transcriptional regulator [Vibrio sinus]
MFKKHLKKAGISYSDLAEYLNVSEVSVKRLLNQQQPLSMSRMLEIADLIQIPLSNIIHDAEKAALSTPLFSKQQDEAFFNKPELFTLFSKICCKQANYKELMKTFGLDKNSMYLYLRELEELKLIKLTSDLNFRMVVPRHIVFESGSRFPAFYKEKVIDGLKKRIQVLDVEDKTACLNVARLQITQDEFQVLSQKIEELLTEARNLSYNRETHCVNSKEHTVVVMGAEGCFYPTMKSPSTLI